MRASRRRSGASSSFIETEARAARALYILGDLFEAWIGDDETTRGSRRSGGALARPHGARRVPCSLMHGNRDFLIGPRFCAATGAQLLGDYERVDLFGSRCCSRTATCSAPTTRAT